MRESNEDDGILWRIRRTFSLFSGHGLWKGKERERERGRSRVPKTEWKGMGKGDQKMAGSGFGLYSLVSAVVLFRRRQMLRWSTSLPGKNFKKPQKTFTKNPQIPSVHNLLLLATPLSPY